MMRTWAAVGIGLVGGMLIMGLPKVAAAHLHRLHSQGNSGAKLEHTHERFDFIAKGKMADVAPLFGADRERVWAPGWSPEFLYPSPAKDASGMVFQVRHGHLISTWVNTQFDLVNGRVQYVYVIPGALATLITIRLTPEGDSTRVAVEYERTALSADANDHVRELAAKDAKAGKEWEEQVNGALQKHQESGSPTQGN